MTPEDKKRAAAEAAVEYVKPDTVIGVGTGSTVNHFIDLLAAKMGDRITAAVSSSEASSERLLALGIPVVDLNEAGQLDLYVDGADESNDRLQLIKGGGGALTREKIVAAASREFICIADDSKLVATLGAFPLPVEVIPMARELVADELRALGGEPRLRADFITDNGNQILDVHGLQIDDALDLETRINQLAGVVCVGLFAHRPADLLILGGDEGISTLHRQATAQVHQDAGSGREKSPRHCQLIRNDLRNTAQKKARIAGFSWSGVSRLTLRELYSAASFAQPDFLALNFTRIAGHKAFLAQGFTKCLVVCHQGTGNAKAYRAGLAARAATGNAHVDIECIDHIDGLQRLAHHHARGFATEVIFDAFVVDGNRTATRLEINARC